jgi:hypothetical protein
MIKTIKRILTKSFGRQPFAASAMRNQALMLGSLHAMYKKNHINLKNLKDVELKVFSQWGDDGIIQYLINKLDIPNKTFIEFGVANYEEANTRFLLMHSNWSGLIMDGSKENIDYIKNDEIYWQYDLQAVHAFIDTDNVNGLISSAGFDEELGLLHIDIDGNDYWVWQAVKSVNPIIVIVEYNSLFGSENAWTTPYDPAFTRTNYHHTNLCYGSSLTSLCDMAGEKGYYFIGSNSAGNNAYFIRKDKIADIKPLSISQGYIESKFKESRDKKGGLSFLRGNQRFEAIKGAVVFDTRLKTLVEIK